MDEKIKCKYCRKLIQKLPSIYETNYYHSSCLKKYKQELRDKEIEERLKNSKKHKQKLTAKEQIQKLVKIHNKLLKDKEKYLGNKTLQQYEIYKEALKIGKKINPKYSKVALAKDFNISLGTAKRILSLEYATENTWKLIRTGKISAIRVAEIIYSKGKDNQTEIINWSIQNKATREQLFHYKTGSVKSMQRIGGEHTALVKKIQSLEDMLSKNSKVLPEPFKQSIRPQLQALRNLLDELLDEWEELS